MCIRDRGMGPPDHPEKRLRRAHRPVSLSTSNSAREMVPNPADEALKGGSVEAVHVRQFKLQALLIWSQH
eukprot:7388617-Alexandrium_andersonii.AAC.1